MSSISKNPSKLLFYGYIFVILIGSFLLMLPTSTYSVKNLSFLDALFTSVSATCVTGLVVVDTGYAFTTFGKIVILSLIQIGGLGFMTFTTVFAIMIGKHITLSERFAIQESLNQLTPQGIVRLTKMVFVFALTFELIGTLLLAFRFSWDMPLKQALFFGFFHSISAFNNAGFDILGPIAGQSFSSLTTYAQDPTINIAIGMLVILGGIGFITVSEIFHKGISFRKFSMHSKMVLSVTGVLLVLGTLLMLALEWSNPKTIHNFSWGGKFIVSFFHSVSPRTAGFNTLNLGDMTHASILITMLLMYIGASPGSTGGGIKTTTFVIFFAHMWAIIRGKEEVTFFKHAVEAKTIIKTQIVIFLSLMMIAVSTIILTITEKGSSFLWVAFETVSALGTVGLSLGLTPSLSIPGKFVIMALMIIGRVGALTIIYSIIKQKSKENIRHPKGKIVVG